MSTHRRLTSIFMLATLALAPQAARASIFANGARWPVASDGYVYVPVCVEADSSVSERGDGVLGGLIHDPNPSLAQVVAHVRAALRASWESVTAVRFVGWSGCSDLGASDLQNAARLYLNPNASNEAIVGVSSRGAAHGVSIMPWGNTFNRCIKYSWSRARVGYSFDCVEQYAIHEFGHVIGFLHEDPHPTSTDACLQQFHDTSRISSSDFATDYVATRSYTVVNPNQFDRHSIMTYGDQCADVVGVRFGNTTLSDTDALGAWAVYPPPVGPSDDVLGAGQGLHPGSELRSRNGQFRLAMQTDGNLVLYGPTGVRWATGTYGRTVDYCIMQPDGNLVLYGNGSALWSSGTNGKHHARLVVQDDGNVVIYQLGAVWATGTDSPTSGYLVGERGHGLASGEALLGGSGLFSPNGHFRGVMQTDGNLVVYDDGGVALWASGTNGAAVVSATLSSTGSLMLLDPGGGIVWATGTSNIQNPRLLMQDDGNLVLYSGTAIWATNTNY